MAKKPVSKKSPISRKLFAAKTALDEERAAHAATAGARDAARAETLGLCSLLREAASLLRMAADQFDVRGAPSTGDHYRREAARLDPGPEVQGEQRNTWDHVLRQARGR